MYDVIRAWKDEDYREELGIDLGGHPSGTIDLSAAGGTWAKTTPTGTECFTHADTCSILPSVCEICTTVNCYQTVDNLAWADPELVTA